MEVTLGGHMPGLLKLAHGARVPFAPDQKFALLKQVLFLISHVSYAGSTDRPITGCDVMTRIIFLVLLLVVSPLRADTKTEILSALDYFGEVWSEGDLEAIRSYYHPDFVLIGSSGVIALPQRLADFESVTQEGKDHGELSHSQVTVKELEEKHALAYGRASLKFKDGSSIESWFTTVYVKTPFGWKAIVTSNS